MVAFCAATLYLTTGLYAAISLLLQAISLRYSNASAQQFLTVQLIFGVTYLVSLPLLYNAFTGVCG